MEPNKERFLARSGTKPTVSVGIPRPSVKQTSKNPLLSDSCLEYLNYRIREEEFSSRLYLSMSMWFDDKGYKHSAKLWKKYSHEEMSHADWAREYLLSMGVQPHTPSLLAPGDDYTSLPEIVQLSYDHEIKITEQCKIFAGNALKEGDTMLFTLTQKYLAEQVEEHDKIQNHLDALDAFGTDKIALRLFDNSLES